MTVPLLSGSSSVTNGSAITLTVETKNAGLGTALPTVTRFYLSTNYSFDASDTLLDAIEVPELAAGATSRVVKAVTIPAGTAAGTKYFIAVSDATALVNESLETNNNRSKSITVY